MGIPLMCVSDYNNNGHHFGRNWVTSKFPFNIFVSTGWKTKTPFRLLFFVFCFLLKGEGKKKKRSGWNSPTPLEEHRMNLSPFFFFFLSTNRPQGKKRLQSKRNENKRG